jgi:hypothetical protein
MSKKEIVAQVAVPVQTVHPVFVECKVVANLLEDGKFKTHLVANETIPEAEFNHGMDILTIVQKAKVALEEKIGGG